MSRNFASWPLILVLGLLSLPLVIMYAFVFIDSFTNAPPGSMIPNEFTLEHWQFLIDPSIAGNVWSATLNTLIFACSIGAIVVSLSSMGGYALSRLNMPFRQFFLAGIMVMHAFPSVTLIIGVFLVLQFIGLYDTLIGVVGRDFVLIGADTAASSGGISITSTAVDKIAVVHDGGMFLSPGDASDNVESLRREGLSQQAIAVGFAGDIADGER